MKGNYKPYVTQHDTFTVNSLDEKLEDGKGPKTPILNGKSTTEGSKISGKSSSMNASCSRDLEDENKHHKAKSVSTKHQQTFPLGMNSTVTMTTTTTTGQVRHYMALLGLSIAVVNLYAQNTFFIAIVEMVLPPDQVARPSQTLVSTSTILSNSSKTPVGSPEFVQQYEDESCPIEYRYRDYYDPWRYPVDTISSDYATSKIQPSSNSILNYEDRFNWDAGMQGVLLGACAVGTAPLQILSGRLAEIYGPKWVLVSAGLGTALTNLLVPALARYSFNLLVVNRILMGVSQAGLEPAIVCLMASWLTPSERGFFLSLLLFAICFGSFVGMLITTMILSLGYHWATTFYVAGYLNLIVSILWLLFSSNRPSDSKFLSPTELSYILSTQLSPSSSSSSSSGGGSANQETGSEEYGQGQATRTKRRLDVDVSQAPWARILSCRPVWAFIICKVSTRWCADVVASELPTYLANVLHLSIKLNGIVNSVSAGLFAVFSLLTGYVVNGISHSRERALKENRPQTLSKTTIRKIFQALGSFGSTVNLLLMVRYDCDLLFSIVMLLMLSCALVLGAGGELQIPYDMTSKYPGTLHGIACTLAVSGWLAPPTIGLILGDEPTSRYRWTIVWHLTAAINFIGGLAFVLFADASARDFDLDSSGTSTGQHQDAGDAASLQVVSSSATDSTSCRLAKDYKKEPAAAYVNAACDLDEPTLFFKQQQQQQQQQQHHHHPTTTAWLSLRHYGTEAERGGGAAPASSNSRQIALQNLSTKEAHLQPDEPLFHGSSCGSTIEQVTRAPQGNWWLRSSPLWRLWSKLAGRRGKFSLQQEGESL